MKLVVYSSDDIAGRNIAAYMSGRLGFKDLGKSILGNTVLEKGDVWLSMVDGSVRDLQSLPVAPEYCIVASRHKAVSGKPALTCHPTGNFGPAQMGGLADSLQLTEAGVLSHALNLLKKEALLGNLDYEVTREVTHHGPTELAFPLAYMEVGSSQAQWEDEVAYGAVARAIDDLTSSAVVEKASAIGFGGPHYCPNFNDIGGGYCLGHVMSKHSLKYLSSEVVGKMVDKTSPRPKMAVLDWKGMRSDERAKLLGILGDIGLKWGRTTDLK